MSIIRINELPEGSGSLTNDDIFVFMDDPSGSGVTKKISLSQISSAIGGGGGGNPFDQELNTTDFPSFSGVSLSNGTTLAQGTFDNNTGGNNGISLNCAVGYELNWQGGHLKSTLIGGDNAAKIIHVDSPLNLNAAPLTAKSSHITINGLIHIGYEDNIEGSVENLYFTTQSVQNLGIGWKVDTGDGTLLVLNIYPHTHEGNEGTALALSPRASWPPSLGETANFYCTTTLNGNGLTFPDGTFQNTAAGSRVAVQTADMIWDYEGNLTSGSLDLTQGNLGTIAGVYEGTLVLRGSSVGNHGLIHTLNGCEVIYDDAGDGLHLSDSPGWAISSDPVIQYKFIIKIDNPNSFGLSLTPDIPPGADPSDTITFKAGSFIILRPVYGHNIV